MSTMLSSSASLPSSGSSSSLGRSSPDDVSTTLTSLAESAQYGPAVKLIVERAFFQSYPQVLQQNISVKDERIRELCHAHYQEFLASIDHLMAIKGEMAELKGSVRSLNEEVQASAAQLITAATAVNEQRRQRLRINEARDLVRQGQYLVQLTHKCNQQISKHKFFSAVKTLDQLQRVYLPRFAEYDFAKQLELELPLFASRIKTAVRAEFSAWLSSIRERSSALGAAAMAHTQKRLQRMEQRRARQRLRLQTLHSDESKQPHPSSSLSLDSSSASALLSFSSTGDLGGDDDDEGLLDAVSINFAPVYQCLHIYTSLSLPQRFTSLYKRKRRAQLIQAMELAPRTKDVGYGEYNLAYFSSIAGFFVLEDGVMKGENELMSRAEVDGLFDVAVQKVRSVVKEQVAGISGVKDFMAVKSSVVALMHTVQMYGYRITGLIDLLRSCRERFELIVLGRFQWEWKQCVKAERWQPMEVQSAAEWRAKVGQYGLAPPLDGSERFPLSMSFSASIPVVCSAMAALIDDYHAYSLYVDDSHTPLLRTVDAALTDTVHSSIIATIESKAVHISQATQLAINSAALLDVCSFLEYHLATYLSTSHAAAARPVEVHDIGSPSITPGASSGTLPALLLPPSVPHLHLSSRTLFQQARIRCEDVLFELIDAKIDDFLAALQSPELLPTQIAYAPSDYVTDLTAYLDSTFTSLAHISAAVREAVYFTSCRHIASTLSSYLLNTVKRYNLIGLYDVNSDLHVLENFALRCPVDTLVECFSEVRQLMDLMLQGELEDVLDAAKREKVYPHLSTAKLLKFLDKMKDLPTFGQQKVPDNLTRIKRKQVDAVIRKLQAQQQAQK